MVKFNDHLSAKVHFLEWIFTTNLPLPIYPINNTSTLPDGSLEVRFKQVSIPIANLNVTYRTEYIG